MRIAFIHPDLGIGGAERLVIDAALVLQSRGHRVTIYTPFHSKDRCFLEVAPPQPLIEVREVPPPIPRTVFNRLQAICAALRVAYVTLRVAFERPDAAIVDLVSFPLILLWIVGIPSLFYCHFPDKLLAPSLRGDEAPMSLLRRIYRVVVDSAEAIALRTASVVVCNSRFTLSQFQQVFPALPSPEVVYPCVSCDLKTDQAQKEEDSSEITPVPKRLLLSLNRFESKKNIKLAVETLSTLRKSEKHASQLHLTLAGGFDDRLPENVSQENELRSLIVESNLQDCVTIRKNISDGERASLLKEALAVLYTPSREHFGIVPIEAMAAGVPVIAVSDGGPAESVLHGETGFLKEPTPQAFAGAVQRLVDEDGLAIRLGRAGQDRVNRLFTRRVLGEQLEALLKRITA